VKRETFTPLRGGNPLAEKPSSDSRRKFLKGSFVGISALTMVGQLPALAKTRQEEEAAKRFFGVPENSFLESAVERIIPPDDESKPRY